MTRWLQDDPWALCRKLERASHYDLRETINANETRALLHAASDMIKRNILELDEGYGDDKVLPLHWSLVDRWRDAWACIRGRARVLRRVK